MKLFFCFDWPAFLWNNDIGKCLFITGISFWFDTDTDDPLQKYKQTADKSVNV